MIFQVQGERKGRNVKEERKGGAIRRNSRSPRRTWGNGWFFMGFFQWEEGREK